MAWSPGVPDESQVHLKPLAAVQGAKTIETVEFYGIFSAKSQPKFLLFGFLFVCFLLLVFFPSRDFVTEQ